VVCVASGWVETEASVAMAKRLAQQAGTDYEGGRLRYVVKNRCGTGTDSRYYVDEPF